MNDNDAQMRVYSGNATYGEIQGEGENAKDYRFSWTGGGYMNLNSADSKKNTTLAGQEQLRDCLIAAIWGDDNLYWSVELTYKGQTYPMQRVTKSLSDMCVSAFYRTQLNKSTVTWAKALQTYWYVKVPGLNPDTALERTCAKFRRRFTYLEEQTICQGRNLTDMTLAEMDAIWDEGKAKGL